MSQEQDVEVCWRENKCHGKKACCSHPNGRQRSEIFSDTVNLCFRPFNPAEE